MNSFAKAVLRLSAMAVAGLSLTACATVVRGTNDKFHVETTPPAATVTTSHGFTCTSPCTMELPRKSEFDVTIRLAGYKDFNMHIVNAMSGEGAAGLAGNVLIGGVIGVGVDALTGASLDLKPNPLVVDLAPLDSAEESRIAPEATASAGDH
jgi:hypothetical protein